MVVVSGLLGSAPVLRPLLVVTAATLVVGALYIALLVRLRTRAVEREVKLRYLPQPAESSRRSSSAAALPADAEARCPPLRVVATSWHWAEAARPRT